MAAAKQRIEIYDTTLRDGAQGLNVSLSLPDKLQIARRLDDLGVDYIEGGYPLSNEKDRAFFRDVRDLGLKHAKIVAFGMTRRKGLKPEDDIGMKALVGAKTEAITIVGKTWDLHVSEVIRVSEKENLAMISDSVRYCAKRGREIIYDAEHFFDGYRANPEFALKTILAAQDAGASCVVLCDTNGGMMPEQVAECIDALKPYVSVKIGIHTHNDSGLAVANTLSAIQHGAVHAQGTINGMGERCGNVDLTTVASNLSIKLGYEVLRSGGVLKLTELSRFVYEIANMIPADNQPFVGRAAFAHKGGMHVHAVRRLARSYEHIDPRVVGNARTVLISELGGASGVAEKMGEKFDIAHDKKLQRKLLRTLQEYEDEGYVFESAEASFELICRKELGRYREFWDLHHWRAVALKSKGQDAPDTEVIMKLSVNNTDEHHVAGGHGPVDAMASALVMALRSHYPNAERLRLIDYKVRVINPKAATAARVRVTIEFRDEDTHNIFSTVGVSENVIEASWIALSDGFKYKLLNDEESQKAPSAKRKAPKKRVKKQAKKRV